MGSHTVYDIDSDTCIDTCIYGRCGNTARSKARHVTDTAERSAPSDREA